MTTFLSQTYYSPIPDNINQLREYLKSISGKELKLACKRQYGFATKFNEQDTKMSSRCHIQNAITYLDSLKPIFRIDQIKILIADLCFYVEILDTNEDTSFLRCSPNTLPSTIHFEIANRLFQSGNFESSDNDNYSTDLLALFGLRLALEKRIKGLLGIDSASDNGKDIGLSVLIETCTRLNAVLYSKDFMWPEIKLLNTWINHHVHRAIRPYPWSLFMAFETLRPFISPKKVLHINGRKINSWYSATFVSDEQILQEEIEQILNEKSSDIKIKWLPKREIAK